MIVHCDKIVMVPILKLKPHPKNRNKHPKAQIVELAAILAYQGWRYPIKVSRRSGFITTGHGRWLAAKYNKWTEVPVSYQDYESEEQEYADVIADNGIALWSDMDLSAITGDIAPFGPDWDVKLLGIQNFQIEPADAIPQGGVDPDLEWSKEIDEKNDYIVLLFDSKEKFKEVCEKLGIKSVNVQLSPNAENDRFIMQGVGRVIDGEKILTKL